MTDRDERDETAAQRAKQLKKLLDWKEQLHNDRTTLLSDPAFCRVMSDMIARSGMFQSVMTGNSQTYHKSGRQDFGREIWSDLANADLDAAHELLKPPHI